MNKIKNSISLIFSILLFNSLITFNNIYADTLDDNDIQDDEPITTDITDEPEPELPIELTGSCMCAEGQNVYWILNFENKSLTITGEGEYLGMLDLPTEYEDYKYLIETVILDVGITKMDMEYSLDTPNVKRFEVSKNFSSIQVQNIAEKSFLEEIIVPKDNEYFTTLNGVLYSKDMSKLICYPSQKQDVEFVIPESVTSIGYMAFKDNPYLEKVTLPQSLDYIDNLAFDCDSNLKEINIFNVENFFGQPFSNTPWSDEHITNDKGWLVIDKSIYMRYAGEHLEKAVIPTKVNELNSNILGDMSPTNLICLGNVSFAEDTFLCNTNLESVIIDGNAHFSNNSFHQVENVKDIVIYGDCYFDYNALNCWTLENITVYGDCYFEYHALNSCNVLKNISIYGNCYFENQCFFQTGVDNISVMGNITGNLQFSGIEYPNTKFVYNPTRLHLSPLIIKDNSILKAETKSISITEQYGYIFGGNTIELGYGTYENIDRLQECITADRKIYACANSNVGFFLFSYDENSLLFNATYKDYIPGASIVGDDNCVYVLWGKCIDMNQYSPNLEDDTLYNNDTENVVIKKYDLNGNELDSFGFKIADTDIKNPFAAGNAVLTYNDGILGIGINIDWLDGHQGSEIFLWNIVTREVENLSKWGGSHSFGLTLLPTDFGVVTFQRGDDHPRGIQFGTYGTNYHYNDETVSREVGHCIFYVKGNYEAGDYNETYMALCGASQSETTYAVLAKSEMTYTSQCCIYDEREFQNLFIKLIDKTTNDTFKTDLGVDQVDVSTGEVVATDIIWITNYTNQDNVQILNARLTTLENGSYCVLWQEFSDNLIRTYYMLFDDCGHIVRDKTEVFYAMLSNYLVPPVVKGNQVIWAVADTRTVNNLYGSTSSYEYIDWYTLDLSQHLENSYSTSDYMLIKKAILNIIPKSKARDINHDGTINILDLCEIQNMFNKN